MGTESLQKRNTVLKEKRFNGAVKDEGGGERKLKAKEETREEIRKAKDKAGEKARKEK